MSNPEPSGLSDAFRSGLERSPFASIEPGATPTGRDVWAALGGKRGVIESLLPGLVFLVVYTLTQSLWWSVLTPLAASVGFILARLIQKSPIQPALIGLVGVALSAFVAIVSGRPENNFVLGLWVNAISLGVILGSFLFRRPIIGVIAGILVGDDQWHQHRARFAMASVATLLWAGMFGLRLLVQVPLYWAGEPAVQALATAKLVMGVPLYGLTLWLTWLLLRSVYRPQTDTPE
ncbi:intracellular septation protein A [Pontimonas salivibrio]|uniref:Intracellular septation protein A n=1 Tax=Pontimonas salivibrio TaxID=1159327 RepID=A0A2L2BQH5_9MICO|nr:DUF3159 domain-containing protein [Pontimonas salivibrio]AVG23911.1 intracellular septation protein A [Pontimonas salivibrio]